MTEKKPSYFLTEKRTQHILSREKEYWSVGNTQEILSNIFNQNKNTKMGSSQRYLAIHFFKYKTEGVHDGYKKCSVVQIG